MKVMERLVLLIKYTNYKPIKSGSEVKTIWDS